MSENPPGHLRKREEGLMKGSYKAYEPIPWGIIFFPRSRAMRR